MFTVQQAIADVRAGKYVDVDIATAYHVISNTQSLGRAWVNFLKNAPSAVLHANFSPCINSGELRNYVIRKLEMPSDDKQESPMSERVGRIFDSASIYLQRYDINIKGTKAKVFIRRTPTEVDFDRARAVILFVLEVFSQSAKSRTVATNSPSSQVTVTVRGMEKFFDINIGAGINKEAWVGFDFR